MRRGGAWRPHSTNRPRARLLVEIARLRQRLLVLPRSVARERPYRIARAAARRRRVPRTAFALPDGPARRPRVAGGATRPPDPIDTAAMRADYPVAAVVARHGIALRPIGCVLVGRCPFHRDRGRPNLHVYADSASRCRYRCARNARQVAEDNKMEWWDRDNLANVLNTRNHPEHPRPIPSYSAWLLDAPRRTPGVLQPTTPPVSDYTCATLAARSAKGPPVLPRVPRPLRRHGLLPGSPAPGGARPRRQPRRPARPLALKAAD